MIAEIKLFQLIYENKSLSLFCLHKKAELSIKHGKNALKTDTGSSNDMMTLLGVVSMIGAWLSWFRKRIMFAIHNLKSFFF